MFVGRVVKVRKLCRKSKEKNVYWESNESEEITSREWGKNVYWKSNESEEIMSWKSEDSEKTGMNWMSADSEEIMSRKWAQWGKTFVRSVSFLHDKRKVWIWRIERNSSWVRRERDRELTEWENMRTEWVWRVRTVRILSEREKRRVNQ